MNDHLEQQLVNELRALLQPLNEKYKDFFHVQLITLCDMKDQKCSECINSETGQQCRRCVIGITETDEELETPEEIAARDKVIDRLFKELYPDQEKS